LKEYRHAIIDFIIMKEDVTEKIKKLKHLSLVERVKEIENDIISNSGEYKNIEPQELARLLEVPLDAVNGENPDDWSKWATWNYVEILSLEQLSEKGYQINELLDYLDNENRVQFLSKQVKNLKKIYHELTPAEKIQISLALADNNLNSLDGDRHLQIAQYSVHTQNKTSLRFEATLNGDCSTMNSLKTPYDERDGKFLNVESNKKMYLSKFLNDI